MAAPAFLKLATDEDERAAGALLAWWSGDDTARVFAHDERALLMERAEGNRSLSDMAREGQDEECTLGLAIEPSSASWVLAAQVPGLPRVKAKRTIEPTAEALLAALRGDRERAQAAGRQVERVIATDEAGRSGFGLRNGWRHTGSGRMSCSRRG